MTQWSSSLSPRAVAMNYLALREHTACELKQKLIKKGFDLSLVEATILALQSDGLQSDQRFSEMYVHYRAQRGYGSLRIEQELRLRGVSEVLISQAIAQFSFQEWHDLAIKAFAKRFGNVSPSDYKMRAAQMRFLLYRGFSAEIARDVLHSSAREAERIE